jgi:glutathione S-transferase
MQLFWSSRSPFARKVTVAAHELGVAERLRLERVVVSMDRANDQVMAHNPLSQIPTLVRPDGRALFGSAVIVEWLDWRFGPGRLLPAGGEERFAVLRAQAIADGIMENSIRRLGERARGPLFSEPHSTASWLKIRAALDGLEREGEELETVNAGSIAVAVAIAHLDFRHGDQDWRRGRPGLAAWHDRFSARPSMRATAYRDEA